MKNTQQLEQMIELLEKEGIETQAEYEDVIELWDAFVQTHETLTEWCEGSKTRTAFITDKLLDQIATGLMIERALTKWEDRENSITSPARLELGDSTYQGCLAKVCIWGTTAQLIEFVKESEYLSDGIDRDSYVGDAMYQWVTDLVDSSERMQAQEAAKAALLAMVERDFQADIS